MENTVNNHRWYAIKVMNNKEKEVKKIIEREVELNAIPPQHFSECLIATEREIKSKNGKKYTYEKVTYQGYVFLKCLLTAENERHIKRLQNVLGFVGDRQRTALPLKEEEVNTMIGRIEEKKSDPLKYIVGDSVRILDGAFASFNGTITSVGDKKAEIEVLIFGRPNNIELEYPCFEKCDAPAPVAAPVEKVKRARSESKAKAVKVEI